MRLYVFIRICTYTDTYVVRVKYIFYINVESIKIKVRKITKKVIILVFLCIHIKLLFGRNLHNLCSLQRHANLESNNLS
jgi:hypothetical protein